MCELFGFTAAASREISQKLKSFFSHSTQHPDGWGLAVFDSSNVNIEKEPVPAFESVYLSNRITVPVSEKLVMAHIRKASVGNIRYGNTHPFAGRDAFGKNWVLTHNGTLFSEPEKERYEQIQSGTTDSERILVRFLEMIGSKKEEPTVSDCIDFLNQLMDTLCIDNNKVNMMLSDGVHLFVYANHADKLWMQERTGEITFATVPLTEEAWVRVPECRVLVFRDGQLLQAGPPHGISYIPPEST